MASECSERAWRAAPRAATVRGGYDPPRDPVPGSATDVPGRPMPLWLEQLLEDPALGLALVAGRRGLRSRGPVRWVHISEIPDPTPWLEGGEILLTTGLGVRDSPELQRKLVAGLDQRGCSGVGFALGIWMEQPPPAMLEEAEARDLPLFTVPYEVPFIAITKRVSHAIAAEHYATLRSAVDLHRRILAAVVGGARVPGVLATVAPELPDHACLAFDYYGTVLARHDPARVVEALDAERLWEQVRERSHIEPRFELDLAGRVVTGASVRVADELEAVLILIGRRALHEHEALLMEQALAGLSLELARGLSVREARRSRVDDLLSELSTGRVGPRDAARALERLGTDARSALQVLCVRRAERVGQQALSGLVEDVLAAARPVVGRLDSDVYAIVASPASGLAARVLEAAFARGWRTVAVGTSRVKTTSEGLSVAVREAAAAAAAAAPGTHRDITELDVHGLLASIGDAAGLDAFVTRILGPVIEHDARESAQLVDSLRAYLRHGCRPGPAAAELCVHRHTLAYRLDRIGNLTGRDPREGRHLLDFGLALALLDRRPGDESDR